MRSINVSLFRSAPTDGFYHVVLRPLCREPLASTARDRRQLNHITIDVLRRYDIKLHAYCLLANQLRALIQIDERVLVEALRRIANRYGRYKQDTMQIAGPFFERPYLAQPVASDQHFLELLRRIHLSPVRSNQVVAPSDYPWSSHRAYVGFKSNALITTTHGLSLFSPESTQARMAYREFMTEGNTSSVEVTEAHDPYEVENPAPLISGVPSELQPESIVEAHIRRGGFLTFY